MSFIKEGKNNIWRNVAIIVTIILMGIVIMQYTEIQKLKDQVTDYDTEQWYSLLRMTEYVENFQIDSRFDAEHGNHIYANQICHSFSANKKVSSFLRATYDPLHLDMSIIEEGPAKDVGLELLEEMNTYIMNISRNSRDALIKGEIYEPENLDEMKYYFEEEVDKYFKTYN